MWYNSVTKKEKMTGTSNAGTVTISRTEYEEFQAQRERISALEKQEEILMEAIRLARQKRFGVSSERINDDRVEQLSLLFDEAEEHWLPESKLVCLECGDTMVEIGKGVRRQLKMIPAKAVVIHTPASVAAKRTCKLR